MVATKSRGGLSVFSTVTLASALYLLLESVAFGQTHGSAKRLGILAVTVCPTAEAPLYWGPLLQNLRERGWVEGRTVMIDCLGANAQIDRVPALAEQLLALHPDVVLGAASPTIRALRQATSLVPIVTASPDPLQDRFVDALAHPGANITGLAPMSFELAAKRLELLKDLLPRLSRVALLSYGGIQQEIGQQTIEKGMNAAAQKLGISWTSFFPNTADDIDDAFARISAGGFDAAYVWATPFSLLYRKRIAEAALRHRVPTISDNTEFAREGLLLTYGYDLGGVIGDAAEYIDKLFRGAKPDDLPLKQPTKFVLAVNVRTASALGINVPSSVALRADELIE